MGRTKKTETTEEGSNWEGIKNKYQELQKKTICFYRYEPKFAKELKIEPCFIDEKDALFSVHFRNKEGFCEGKKPICQNDKNKELLGCFNKNIPFQIAPCKFFKQIENCIQYSLSEMQNPEVFINSWEKPCKNLIPLRGEEISKGICFICCQPAKYLITIRGEPFQICAKHASLRFGCKKNNIFPLAICTLLENNEDCILFELLEHKEEMVITPRN